MLNIKNDFAIYVFHAANLVCWSVKCMKPECVWNLSFTSTHKHSIRSITTQSFNIKPAGRATSLRFKFNYAILLHVTVWTSTWRTGDLPPFHHVTFQWTSLTDENDKFINLTSTFVKLGFFGDKITNILGLILQFPKTWLTGGMGISPTHTYINKLAYIQQNHFQMEVVLSTRGHWELPQGD